MSQSLYTAMGGISAAQTSLNVISNNIANLNTTGFKSSSVNFSDVFYTTISSGTAATGTTGGVNPEQVGLGVQVSSVSKDFSSGTWVSTGKTTDLMIQGNGFFTCQDSAGQQYYSRAGDFSFDSDGDLVTNDGYKVLGTDSTLSTTSSTTAVHLPQKIVTIVSPTTAAAFGAESVGALNMANITAGQFTITTTTGTSPNVYNINLSATDVTTGTVAQLQTTMQNQINAVDPTSGITVGITNGQITFTLDNAEATAVTFTNPLVGASNFLKETGLANNAINPATHTYTSNLMDETVAVTQVTSIDAASTISSYSIGSDGSIEATYNNGDTLSVEVGADKNTYQFLYTTAEGVKIKGGNVNVDPNVANPANFVIQLASVTNNDGLIATGSNLYTAGPNAGDIIYSIGDAMGLGGIASGGLEASNVDLSAEFSSMILAQRAVQANSRVFTTTSNIMDAIVQMGR